MSKFSVQRSIVILSDIETVKKSLIDFKAWRAWSPWLIMERDAVVNFSQQVFEVGAFYNWRGEIIGSGSMELMKIQPHQLSINVSVKKPFRYSGEMEFYLKELERGVEVRWHMDVTYSFFLFWMKGRVKTLLGMDFERGLKMLKEYAETGAVASSIDVSGVVTLEGQKYIGIANSCDIKDMGEVMRKDFEMLQAFIKENKIFGDRIPFTIYNTFDMVKGKSKFISCMPLEQDLKIDRSWKQGRLKGMQVLSVNHIGAYEHLGNGWTTAFAYAKKHKIWTKKKPLGYEFYFTDPKNTSRSKLLTEICLPIVEPRK